MTPNERSGRGQRPKLELADYGHLTNSVRCGIDVRFEPATSPHVWARMVLERWPPGVKGRVAEHLVGATLQLRFPALSFAPHSPPAYAPAAQDADFTLSGVSLSVRMLADKRVLRECAHDLEPGNFAMLLVPRDQEERARFLAVHGHLQDKVMVLSIEDFVSLDVIHLAIEQKASPFSVMMQIVDLYNERLSQVETDQSLRIELR